VSKIAAPTKVKRADLCFLHDAKECVPNGDPYTGMQRYDDKTERIMCSDVRIKRYARDFRDMVNIMTQNIIPIYVLKIDREEAGTINKNSTGSATRIQMLRDMYGEIPVVDLLKKCWDPKLYGCVVTEKDQNVHFTGSIQFKALNSSLNRVELRLFQNTSVFESSMNKNQGSIGKTHLVPYALISYTASVNPLAALALGTTEKDIIESLFYMWYGVNNYKSRSKTNQYSRLMLKINYKDPWHHSADVDTMIQLTNGNDLSLREFSQLEWDFSKMIKLIKKDIVSDVEYLVEESFSAKFLDLMKEVKGKLTDISSLKPTDFNIF